MQHNLKFSSSLQTPEMGSPISKHCQKPDLVQMKTFKEETIHRNGGIPTDKCPIHNPYPLRDEMEQSNTLNHAREKNRRLPTEIPPPPNVVPQQDGVEIHGSHGNRIVHGNLQCLPQSVSFPGNEKSGTIRYVQSGTLTKGQIPFVEKSKQNCSS